MGKKGNQNNSVKSGNGSETNKKKLPHKSFDDTFIIFSNSEKEPKLKGQSGSAGCADEHLSVLGEVPKRAPAKKLIGGASWTGKLPVNILSEHCQRQKWEKPEYTMTKTAEGYSSMVVLKAKNPKTKKLEMLPPFKLPKAYRYLTIKPSALEARHFAATYALFRVCSMRNIHMMIPPDYRKLWKGEFESLKIEDNRQGRSWMYEADPFAVMRDRNEAKVTAEKKRADKEKDSHNFNARKSDNFASGNSILDNDDRTHVVSRVFAGAPSIEMGKRTRAKIEDLVRKYTQWNPYGVKILEHQKNSIINEYEKLGFRSSHIEEAVQQCKDKEETLEWLLIHVPEDDLPRWTLPEGYIAGVTFASSDMKKERAIQRLAEAGYSLDLCKQALDKMSEEALAAEYLQSILISNTQNSVNISQNPLEENISSHDIIWEQEISNLDAVFGERYTRLSKYLCQVILQPEDNFPPIKAVILLRKSQYYPSRVPIISIHADLPAYIRLSIIKQALAYCIEHLLGEQMLFSLVDWVEIHFHKIVKNPGKLGEVSPAASIKCNTEKKIHQWEQPFKSTKALNYIKNLHSRDDWARRQKNPKLQLQIERRKMLPAWAMKQEIIDSISMNQVSIISGETGSGKSTQCVQFILDDMYDKQLGECTQIICTQPRRISAIGLAERVSDERCSKVGQEVGYIIRGESKISQKTKIKFVTTGILLRKLQNFGGSIDDVTSSIADISHIIIDEVHERSLDIDLLLAVLREIMRKWKKLKVILMSATLDADIFETYFRNLGTVGRVVISGRTYPVEDFYLDDILQLTRFNIGKNKEINNQGTKNDFVQTKQNIVSLIRDSPMVINYHLIAELVKSIDGELSHLRQNGGILIFMPGVSEINKILDHLKFIPNLHVLPLYASLQPTDQRKVFHHTSHGERKVVVATNIAETSITIDDIVAVIDSGLVKETSYDPHSQIQKLQGLWATRAACKQRSGRAGRVQAGKCYKLYTRDIEINTMQERPEPEIRRVPLEKLCLSVRAMGIEQVNKFLSNTLTPPENLAVDNALNLLHRMGVLDKDQLTGLGFYLSMIPADLRCGKLMVYGAMFGCLDACVSIAAILTIKSPFISPSRENEEQVMAIRSNFAKDNGDLIGYLRAFEKWNEMKNNKSTLRGELRRWCQENFLSYQNLSEISSNKVQLMGSLYELSLIPSNSLSEQETTRYLNRNNSNTSLIRCLCAGAFNPQITRISFPEKRFASSFSGTVALDPDAKTIKYYNQGNRRVFIHPSSTLFKAQSFAGSSIYLTYFQKLTTTKDFIRDLTPFNAYSALFFCGPITLNTATSARGGGGGGGIIVDGWLHLKGWARIGVLVNRLRYMLDDLLACKIDDPQFSSQSSLNFSSSSEANEIIDVVLKIIEFNGLDQ